MYKVSLNQACLVSVSSGHKSIKGWFLEYPTQRYVPFDEAIDEHDYLVSGADAHTRIKPTYGSSINTYTPMEGCVMNKAELDKMGQMEITHINPATLVDTQSILIDQDSEQAEKAKQFLSQIHNPYCFLCGDTPVRVRFVRPEKPLSLALLSFFSRLKSM